MKETDPHVSGARFFSGRVIWITAFLAGVIAVAIGFGFQLLRGDGSAERPPGASGPSFVGSENCASCHQAQAQLWRSSQHKLAMQHASDKTVLGDFSEASFDYYGVHSRFFTKDG